MIARSLCGAGLAALVGLAWAGLLVFSLGVFPLSLETAWASPLIVAVQCWLFVGLFILAHDAMHGSLTPAWPGLNTAIGRLALFLYVGFPFEATQRKHREHHRRVGRDGDPDFHASNRYWTWYASFLRSYFSWRNALFVSSVLTGLLLLGASWPKVLLFWAAPAILSSLQLFTFGTYLPHRRCARGFSDSHNARSNDWPEWVSLFSCFHFGYHHEHHLNPGEPWWRLPHARRLRRGLSLEEARA